LPAFNIYNDGWTDDNGAGELTISRNKRELWVALGPGAVVIDVEKATSGDENPIAGKLVTPTFSSAAQVVLSPKEDYAFISQEYGNNATKSRGVVQVFMVDRSSGGFVSGTYIGYTELQLAVVGMALSADGQSLFVTSEATLASVIKSGDRGILSVLDVAKLKKSPSKALKRSVDAGCEPVRVAVSPDGRKVWVTARHSNRLVVFDSNNLINNHTSNALVTTIQVGTSPVGLIFVNNGRHVITADSNRDNQGGATTGLTIVNVDAALTGTLRFPRIPTGLFPRSFAVNSNGSKLLVSQYESNAVQELDISHLSRNGTISTSPSTRPTAPFTGTAFKKLFGQVFMLLSLLVAFILP
jgi:DNA-binding beta-propeller fold protein YncE